MSKEPLERQSYYYRIASLERAICRLRDVVARPQDNRTLHLMPTESAMLLEAARIGLSEIYRNPSLIKMGSYPFP